MSGWRIVIPSAGRPDVIGRRSLAYLDRCGIDPDRVTIYVPSVQARTEYAFTLPARWRRRIDVIPHDPTLMDLSLIGVRPQNIGIVRNAIVDRSAVGDLVVSMDDDLGGIRRKTGEQTSEEITDLEPFITGSFGAMRDVGSALWGVYPAPNPYFMKDRVRTDLVHIPAGFHGFEVRGEPWQHVTLDSKEEFERSIRYYLATGRSCRFDYVCMDTHGYAGKGGLQMSRTWASAHRGCEWLVETFPDLCTLNTSKKSGWTEVRLKDRRPR